MIKLPEIKYVPKHNHNLKAYAIGWNTVIDYISCKCSEYSDSIAEIYLADLKEAICNCTIFPFYKGEYDCILEIEKLNEEESDHRLDNFFQDSLDALDKLNIRSEQKKADELADEEFLEHGFICGYSVKDLLLFAYACRRQGITENQLQDYRLTFEEVYKIVLAEVKDITKKLGEEK